MKNINTKLLIVSLFFSVLTLLLVADFTMKVHQIAGKVDIAVDKVKEAKVQIDSVASEIKSITTPAHRLENKLENKAIDELGKGIHGLEDRIKGKHER